MNKKDKHNNYGKLAAAAENGERERERGAPDHDPNELKSMYHDLTFKSRLECRERTKALFDSIEFRTEARGSIYICWNEELVQSANSFDGERAHILEIVRGKRAA